MRQSLLAALSQSGGEQALLTALKVDGGGMEKTLLAVLTAGGRNHSKQLLE